VRLTVSPGRPRPIFGATLDGDDVVARPSTDHGVDERSHPAARDRGAVTEAGRRGEPDADRREVTPR